MSGNNPKKKNIRVQKIVHKTSEVTEELQLKDIPVETLELNSILPCTLYIKTAAGKLKKVLDKGKAFTPGIRSALGKLNLWEVQIDYDEQDAYLRYIDGIRQKKIQAKKEQLRAQSTKIYTRAADTLKELFNAPESSGHYKTAKDIVDDSIDFVLSDHFSINALTEVSSKDYHSHTHSVDTAIFALGFGHHLGFSKTDLHNLGCSAIFHDIGKSRVDPAIINKDGLLDDDEFEQIKKHSLYGYFILKAHKENNQDILNGVRYHHEKYDGSGYPDKLRGKDIPLFAQIVSLGDIFSAISTRKTYRDALSSFEAINIMKNSMSHAFDGNLFLEFVKFMGPKEIAKDDSPLFV